MDELGFTQESLAEAVGVSQTAIYKITSGQTLEPKKIVALARILQCDISWLTTGIESGLVYSVINQESNAHDAPKLGRFIKIPIVGMAQLGDNGHWSEMEFPVGFGDGYIPFPTTDQNAYALRCVGDSMKPRIKDGEFVIIEPNTEPIPGDEVLIKAHDGRVMIKTLLYKRDDRVHVMSINEAHPPQSFSVFDIDKMHFVSAVVKKAAWDND